MKLFIADIDSLKGKFAKIGFPDKDVKRIFTVLLESNKANELDESKKKELEKNQIVPEFECKFHCQAGTQLLTLEGVIQKFIDKGVGKVIKWFSPVYVGGAILTYIAYKPQINSAFQSVYCYVVCNKNWPSWLGF